MRFLLFLISYILFSTNALAKKEIDTAKESKTYYQSGNLKTHKIRNFKDSSGSYIFYYESGQIHSKGSFIMKEYYSNSIDDSCLLKNIFDNSFHCDLNQIDECLFGKCEVFYFNGKLKEVGLMDTFIYLYEPHSDVYYWQDPLNILFKHHTMNIMLFVKGYGNSMIKMEF